MDFQKEDVTENKYKEFRKNIELSAGESLKDNTELMAFANKTIPTGKKAVVAVKIRVHSIIDEEEIQKAL